MDACHNQPHLHDVARACLACADPMRKVEATRRAASDFLAGLLLFTRHQSDAQPPPEPGRPERPRLVAPRALAARGLGTEAGRAAFVHAIAHIEFNAINLAWDAVARFPHMPIEFHADWIAVADDEARHFMLLQERLGEMGFSYGDFDAHDGLWQMARATADSCLARMALVPRVLEARGLDVTPAMIDKLRAAGDRATASILELILREEEAHVAAGSHWFRFCCALEGLEPESTFRELLRTRAAGVVRGPFNLPARRRAGFSEAELAQLGASKGSNP